jgi:maltose alpha-D-glucosyltransferase / alpha-amylase
VVSHSHSRRRAQVVRTNSESIEFLTDPSTASRCTPCWSVAIEMSANSLWFKDAVIYQLHVKSFCDSDEDGIGDFRGLTSRLDYLEELGVDCLWLLPMYPSPFRDDGYDIADYYSIHPSYGTLDDFREFLDAAHRRRLRVITELVLNHTSDQHAWFKDARSARDNIRREWYVWSDTDDRYADVRIIFLDTEQSNWAWDPISKAYYWHRFFSHQPDLNYDIPAVREEMWNVMRFWLDLGVDGFRVDAVPYLIERDGTSCENLPETHDVLKFFRARLDQHFQDKVLLAEANQWPEDVRPYFGDGDEFHMAFHFPLMPRMFMALRLEDRKPLVEIVERTPALPETCQWGIFLRNHDELTLEMVTDIERDYMYEEYARDPVARLNLGIRRRLAPLLEGDRRRVELMNGLLMSLPGSPIVYYGDEIGMGDNIYLGDRNGVRTPMQWNGGWNGGFSTADPERLAQPLISNPLYGYQVVNVEAQRRSDHSLLNWMRRLIRVRKSTRVFGRGSISFLNPPNHRVLAYVRSFEGETVLVVTNLSGTAQVAELDLRPLAGAIPIEMFGHSLFPRIGELPYMLTLSPYGFFWFKLRWL